MVFFNVWYASALIEREGPRVIKIFFLLRLDTLVRELGGSGLGLLK